MAYLNGRKIFSPIQVHTEGIQPSGTINITENGTYDVTEKASANVNVDSHEATIRAFFSNNSFEINDVNGAITSVNITQLQNTKITRLILPECTFVGYYAFKGSAALTTVVLDNCTEIGREAFMNCTALTSVSIPALMKFSDYEGVRAFAGCTNLQEIELPATLSMIIQQTFNGCSSLKKIILRRTVGITALDSINAFASTPFNTSGGDGGTAYVPDDLISSYEANNVWSSLANITFKGLSELDD